MNSVRMFVVMVALAVCGFAPLVSPSAHGRYSDIVLLDDENWGMVMNGEHNGECMILDNHRSHYIEEDHYKT